MGKYLIEFDQLTNSETGAMVWKARGFSTLVFDRHGISKLKPMDNDACIEHLQETGWMQNHDNKVFEQGKECGVNDIASNIAHAREAGYEDGYNAGYNAAQTGEYQRGLEDAWEAAKKLSIMTPEEAEKVFPGAEKYNRFNLGYSGAEAVKKLQDYRQKGKADLEIHIGDEIERCDTGEKYIVLQTRLNLWAETVLTALHRGRGDINTYRIDSDGGLRFRKTGNQFPQVAELMAEIGGTDG